MQAMLARVTEPVAYQAFQHFITHAPWDADRVWRRLRAVLPERRGMLILDGTSFPKQGPASVGVARQVLWGAGQDCELPSGGHRRAVDRRAGVVSRAPRCICRRSGSRRWRAQRARIPGAVRFQEKWRLALRLLRQARAAGSRSRRCWPMPNSATSRRFEPRCIDCGCRMRSASRRI